MATGLQTTHLSIVYGRCLNHSAKGTGDHYRDLRFHRLLCETIQISQQSSKTHKTTKSSLKPDHAMAKDTKPLWPMQFIHIPPGCCLTRRDRERSNFN